MDGVARPGNPPEAYCLVPQLLVIRLRHGKDGVRELHLADVYHPVLTGNEKVDLAAVDSLVRVTGTAPGVSMRHDARDSESLLDLGKMLETDQLKGGPAPCGPSRRAEKVRPQALVVGIVGDELEVNKREIVDELVDRAPLLFFRTPCRYG